MNKFKKEIDGIFDNIQDENTELPQSTKNTIARLAYKEKKSQKQFMFKKWVAAAASVVLIIPLIIVLALQPWATGGKQGDNNPNVGTNPFNSLGIYHYQNAVATAAVKTMDASKAKPAVVQVSKGIISPFSSISPMSDIQVEEDGHLKVTYPFTGVRIDRAYEFYVTVATGTNDFVTMNCGEGTLRVIVANFTLFDGIWPALSDEILLVVIGEKGMLHCLGGGGPYDTEYSMHKFLNGTNVEKNTRHEGYGFCVEANNLEGYNLKVIDKDNGTKTYSYIEDSYALTQNGVFYEITDICLPFIDAAVISSPEDYGAETKKLLVSYQTTDENGDDLIQQLAIIITDDTEFEEISLNGLAAGKNVRIEFKNDFNVNDTVWMLEAVKIIGLSVEDL